jgi:tetratricopeptide (TPR) repeat protein
MSPELWEKPGLWERLKPLFDAAMDKPEGERDPFIDEACGDDVELREALHRLVEASGETGAADDQPFDLHRLFPGQRPAFAERELALGRFRIVRQIGSGGMGEVYEAIDLDLGHRIALKTIRADIAGNAQMLARFRKEVELAQKILNPQVCRIHHYEPPDPRNGRPAFLTMELLEGVTLADRIREQGPLPWKEVKAIALEICEGLRAMHEAGIIHRDLKSRNVMLANRNGAVKAVIMDFGLAHEMRTATSETASINSEEHGVAGTAEYMAPEQFEGQRLTPAADIFALGVVMYEMATARHPFPSRTILEAAVQRGRKPPAPSSLKKKLPHRCDEIIGRCLEFDPKKRYGSVKIVAEEISDSWAAKLRKTWLRMLAVVLVAIALASGLLLVPAIRERVQGILFSSREKHIAVLPFEVAGNDPQTQALGDGLMDSIAGKLSNLDAANQTLWVVPASEVRARKVRDVSSALKEFGATIVVQGHFERNGPVAHLRLTLVDPQKTRAIGFADIANTKGDLAALEDDAVTSLGRLINIAVSENVVRNSPGEVGRAAYEDYLAGIGYFQRFDKPGNIERAIDSLQRAVKTDPGFALGFAQLAQVYMMRYRLDPNPEWLKQAEEYCNKAAALDDRLPSTYVALGQVHESSGKYDLAIGEFHRALNLNPRDADALVGIARSYKNAGRNADAEAAYIKAAALRPGDWTGYSGLGVFYDDTGRPRDAIIQYRKALALTPDNAGLYTNLGIAYMDLDDPMMLKQAEDAFKKSIELNPTFVAWGNLGFLYLREHRFEESINASQKALVLNPQSYDVWTNLTAAYEWLKNGTKAAAAREKTIAILRQVLGLNPQNPLAQATLAVMLAKDGPRDEALDKVQISLALSSNDGYVLSQVADAYELLGDRPKAITYLSQAFAHGVTPAQLSGDPYIQAVLSSRDIRTQVR